MNIQPIIASVIAAVTAFFGGVAPRGSSLPINNTIADTTDDSFGYDDDRDDWED
ncbi:hypothetical protein [Corynebacterium yudongzhengii]|uniref:hypothetical protein n=1 Tax=Corynebacterium yudongzhengii TaxID=2080740 RepID=UPI0013047D75|nr:hypothetical protein [Corynebacterium yudongzhengii]